MKPHLAYPILTIITILFLSGAYPTHAAATIEFVSGLATIATTEMSNSGMLRQAFWSLIAIIIVFAGTGAAMSNWGRR